LLAASVAGCSRLAREQPPPGGGSEPSPEARQDPDVTLPELEREAAAIVSASGRREAPRAEASAPSEPTRRPASKDRKPPPGATDYARVSEKDMTLVTSPAARVKRGTPKAAPEGERAAETPDNWRALGFAGERREVPRGLDPSLLAAPESARARGYTYAFLVLNEYPSDAAEKELAAVGVKILGRHASALKVRVPVDPDRLRAIASLAFVESLAYARPAQKVEPRVRESAKRFGEKLPGIPVVISAFDAAALEEIQAWLARVKATVGRVDTELHSVSAVVPPDALDQLASLDSVLFVELSVPGGVGHDQSMPVMGADYIRPGGFGTRFSGAPITFGILDTGFMVGSAAATMHQDLNKFGCGINFTSDAAGVWNDQNGHGTHVLATATGTGTGQARFRGVATGVGGAGNVRIRTAKIWNSGGTGTQAWELDGQNFMDDATACGSGRPQVVSVSGGAAGAMQVGTDARSRGLDQIVWDTRQTWVVCSGNSGPGAGTIWSTGVAKNALTVGNALDSGDGTIGDISNSSSRGPTGDGRMKPTVVATGSTIRSADAGTTNQYDDKSGCSMATPHVSGIAATVMEHYPEFRTLPHLMRAHLMATALLHDNVVAPVNNTPAPDTTRNTFGLGRVSPYVAHWAHLNPAGWSTHWAWRTITSSQWGFRDIDVPRGATRLVVAMSWDEPPASAGASAAVDYDLDLWIDREPFCTPDGKGQCGEWASQSWIDNVEYQIIDNPPPGRYRLKIINWDAPRSGLPAALSATVIRGATAPAMQLSVNATPVTNGRVTVTTTVSNPSWVLSGVHLETFALPSGITLQRVNTTREDGVPMDFTVPAFSLGSIVQGDSRSATWRFRVDGRGSKTLRFRARSENGGLQEKSIVVM
jgi:subtilisin family serine protease